MMVRFNLYKIRKTNHHLNNIFQFLLSNKYICIQALSLRLASYTIISRRSRRFNRLIIMFDTVIRYFNYL